MQAPFRAGARRLTLYNKNMSKIRTSVEWSFGDVANCFKFLDYKNNLNMHLWQRFEYQIGLNKFSVGKCLSHSTQYKVNNKNLQRSTTHKIIFQNLNVVATATADRDAWLVF